MPANQRVPNPLCLDRGPCTRTRAVCPEREGRAGIMTSDPILAKQAALPPVIRLFRYQPARRVFDITAFDPARVGAAADLPPYLVLGALDEAAAATLRREVQVHYVAQQEALPSFWGFPDGAMRTVAFPVAVGDLRSMRARIAAVAAQRPDYPIAAEARLVSQTVYVDERAFAPMGSFNIKAILERSEKQTGMPPRTARPHARAELPLGPCAPALRLPRRSSIPLLPTSSRN